jgi:hypothetical protein
MLWSVPSLQGFSRFFYTRSRPISTISRGFGKGSTYFYYGIRGEKKGNTQSVLEKVLKKIGIDAAQSEITTG